MTAWEAQKRALKIWAVPALLIGIVVTCMSALNGGGLITFPFIFDVVLGVGTALALWLFVAVPTSIVVALARNASPSAVLVIHLLYVFVVMLTTWFVRG